MKKLFTVILLFAVPAILCSQSVLPIKDYGYDNSTRTVDTTLATAFFKTITISSSGTAVSALVSVFASTDTVKVCFDGDTTTTATVSLVLPTWVARQYYRRCQTVQIKGTSAVSVHVEVEK